MLISILSRWARSPRQAAFKSLRFDILSLFYVASLSDLFRLNYFLLLFLLFFYPSCLQCGWLSQKVKERCNFKLLVQRYISIGYNNFSCNYSTYVFLSKMISILIINELTAQKKASLSILEKPALA